MNASRFDTISRIFAQRRMSRRQALAQGGAGLAAGALATTRLASVSAQEATPEAPAAPKPAFLFVQSFQQGSLAPKEGEEGRFTVTLEHGLGQTIYFSDRPDRIVGALPTDTFFDALGFTPDNPPNAALVVESAPGETDIAVVELFAPVFDSAGPTVTYDVQVLAEWERTADLALEEAPADLAALGPDFGAAHLFIDGGFDCPGATIYCSARGTGEVFGEIADDEHGGFCSRYVYDEREHYYYSYCFPCVPQLSEEYSFEQVGNYWSGECNQRFAACNGDCWPVNFCQSNPVIGPTCPPYP